MSTIEIAAEAGDPDALFALGYCYAYGHNNTAINIRKALDLWTAAAFQGHSESVFRIGLCYALGTCVPQDIDAALQMWRTSAAEGCAEAMHTLGVCYLHGEGVEKDIPQAVMWFLLASGKAHPESDELLYELNQKITDNERDEGVRLMNEWLQHRRP